MSDHSSTTIQFLPPHIASRLFKGMDITEYMDEDALAIGDPSKKAVADKESESRERRQLRLAYQERMELEEEYAAELAAGG